MIKEKQTFFYILIRSWKNLHFFERCIHSILEQTYLNYQILFVDDCSGYSKTNQQYIQNSLSGHVVILNHQRSFRKEPFYPLHLRSWKVWLFTKVKKDDFLRPDKSWLQFCEDMVIYFPMLEMAWDKCEVIFEPLYIYNLATQKGDIEKHY